jgi:osmotically-inducible protein OsmY
MKTDLELKRDVEAELSWDPAVKSAAIGVSVKDGVVTLSGHLDSFAEKTAVQKAVRRVEGVKAIAMELDVRLASDYHRNDTDIANAAEMALKWHTLVPTDAIRLTVNEGWIKLEGTVDWDFERQAVEKAVRHIKGVVGITNEIQLKEHPTPTYVQDSIEQALTRQALQQARRIDVKVDDQGVVTLHGKVHSWYERGAAVAAAWSAPGVRQVVNELTIG